MKLSVAMIVKNESAMLADCLKSVEGADEIVICDTGSTDDTVPIAQEFTDYVYTDYKWNDNFAEARNHALSKCTGDWVLTIDADDTLEPGGIEKIRKAIAKDPQAYCLNVRYEAVGSRTVHNIPVLYRRCPEVYWKGAIHNHLSVNALSHSGVTIHYGHSPAHKLDPNRAFRILKKEVDKDPSKPREVYYLAREYRYRHEWILCLYWTEHYLKIGSWAPEMADAHLMKARCLWHLKRADEAKNACLQAIKINANFKEALIFMANASGVKNRDRWIWMAEAADNTEVLFAREKAEKPPAYYEEIYKRETHCRYTEIYKVVANWAGDRRVLDIGCGQGKLGEYIKNYDGFDMVKNPYRVADIYTHDYGDYDIYVLLEVLEHLVRDTEVLDKVPVGKEVIFSVPSFDDPAHVRLFSEDTARWRYRNLVKIEEVIPFYFDATARVWKKDLPASPTYITLCKGRKI